MCKNIKGMHGLMMVYGKMENVLGILVSVGTLFGFTTI